MIILTLHLFGANLMGKREIVLASIDSNVSIISESFTCKKQKHLNLDAFFNCSPTTCGRFISDIILNTKESYKLLNFVKQLFPILMEASVHYEIGTGRVLFDSGNILYNFNLTDFRSYHEREYYQNLEVWNYVKYSSK